VNEDDEKIEEQVEQAFEDADQDDPWLNNGVDPVANEVVSGRVRREDALAALDSGDE
jgi:hypothetical protein